MTHIIRPAPARSRLFEDEDNDGRFPDESLVAVRYPRSKQDEQDDRDTWPWLPGSIGELSIGRQQAEGIEAPAERGYRPEVTLICREDLISVVTISKDGVQRICYADLKVAVLSSQASRNAQVIDIKVGNLVGAAGQVVDDREFLINANFVEHHVIDLREYERRDHGRFGDRAQDVLYHV